MTPQEASEELKEEFEAFKSGIDPADWENPNEELKKIIEANTMAIKALEQQPCEDCISREEAEAIFKNARKSLYELSRKEQVKDFQTREMMLLNAEQFIHLLPSVKTKFTDTEIQKMQELEQAQLEKAYELGKAEMQPCEDCISREDALKAIEEQKKGFYGVERYAIDECHSAVMKLPSVTPSYNSIKPELKPCEDCISRQAVKEMLTAEWTKYMPMELDMNLSFVLDKINELPSVTPKAETEAYNKGYTDAMRDIGDTQ